MRWRTGRLGARRGLRRPAASPCPAPAPQRPMTMAQTIAAIAPATAAIMLTVRVVASTTTTRPAAARGSQRREDEADRAGGCVRGLPHDRTREPGDRRAARDDRVPEEHRGRSHALARGAGARSRCGARRSDRVPPPGHDGEDSQTHGAHVRDHQPDASCDALPHSAGGAPGQRREPQEDERRGPK